MKIGDPVPFTNGTTNFFAKLNFIKDLTEDGNVKSLKIQIEIVDFANPITKCDRFSEYSVRP